MASTATAASNLRVNAAALSAVATKSSQRDASCIDLCDRILAIVNSGEIVGQEKSVATSAVVEAACAVAAAGVSQVATAALKRLVVSTVAATNATAMPLHCIAKLAAAAKAEAYKQKDLVALASQLVLLATFVECDPNIVKDIDTTGSGKTVDTLSVSWLPSPAKVKDVATRVACGCFVAAISAAAPLQDALPYDTVKYVSKLWTAASKEPLTREALIPVLLRLVRPRPWQNSLRRIVNDGYTVPLMTPIVDEVFTSTWSGHMAGTAGAFVASAQCASSTDPQLANLVKLALSAVMPAGDAALDQNSVDVSAAVVAEALLLHGSASIVSVTTALSTVAARIADAKPPKVASVAQSSSLAVSQRMGLIRQGFRLWAAALGSDTIRCQAAEAALSAADGAGSPIAAWTHLSAGRSLLSLVDPPTENAMLAAWGAALRVYNGAGRQITTQLQTLVNSSTAAQEVLLVSVDAVQNEAVELLILMLANSNRAALLVKMMDTLRQGVGTELVARALILAPHRLQHSQQLDSVTRDLIEHAWGDVESSVERALLCAASASTNANAATRPEFLTAAAQVVASLDFPQEQTINRATLSSLTAAAALTLAAGFRDPSHEAVASLKNTAILLLRWSVRSLAACTKAKVVPSHNLLCSRRVGLLLWEAISRSHRAPGKQDESTIALLATVFKESLLLGDTVTLRPSGVASTDPSALGEPSLRAKCYFSPSTSLIEQLIVMGSSRKRADSFPLTTADLAVNALAATFGSGDVATRKKILVLLFDLRTELETTTTAFPSRKSSKNAICVALWMCLVAARKHGRPTAKQGSDLATTLLQQLVALFLPSDCLATKMLASAAVSELGALGKISDVEMVTTIVKASLPSDTVIAALSWITRIRGATLTAEGAGFARQQIAHHLSLLEWHKALAAFTALSACASTVATPSLVTALEACLTNGSVSSFFSPSVQIAASALAIYAPINASVDSPQSPVVGSSPSQPISAASCGPIFLHSSSATFATSVLHSRSLSPYCPPVPVASVNRAFYIEAAKAFIGISDAASTSGSARCLAVLRARMLNELAPSMPYHALVGFTARLPAAFARNFVAPSVLLPAHAQPHQIIAALQQIQQSRPDVLPQTADGLTDPSASGVAVESRAARMDAAAEEGAEGAQASAGLSAAVSRVGGGNRTVYLVEPSTKALILHRVASLLAAGSFDAWPVKARTDLAACIAAAGSFLGPESGLGCDFATILTMMLRAWGSAVTVDGFPLLEDLRVHVSTSVRSVIADVAVKISTAVLLFDVASMSNIHSDDAAVARGVKAVMEALDSKQTLPTAELLDECCAAWLTLASVGARICRDNKNATKTRAAMSAAFSSSNKLLSKYTKPDTLHLLPEPVVASIATWCLDATGHLLELLVGRAVQSAFDPLTPSALAPDAAARVAENPHSVVAAAGKAAHILATDRRQVIHITNATELLLAVALRAARGAVDPSTGNGAYVKAILTLTHYVSRAAAQVPLVVERACAILDTATPLVASTVPAAAEPFVRSLLGAVSIDQLVSLESSDALWTTCLAVAPCVRQAWDGLLKSLPVEGNAMGVAALAVALAPSGHQSRCGELYVLLRKVIPAAKETASTFLLASIGKQIQDPILASTLAIAATAVVLDLPNRDAWENTASSCLKLTTKAAMLAVEDGHRSATFDMLGTIGMQWPRLQGQCASAFSALVARDATAARRALEGLSDAAREQLRSLTAPRPASSEHQNTNASVSNDAPLRLNLSAYR